MMSWSCPFHTFQLPLQVPDIFSVCPLHFPCMSRSFVASHFPTSPVVPIGVLVLRFPLIPPALPLFSFLSLACSFRFPFVFRCFPVMSTSYFLPSFPCTPLHFPPCSPIFPAKNDVFPAFLQLGRPKTQSCSRFSAKGGRNPKPSADIIYIYIYILRGLIKRFSTSQISTTKVAQELNFCSSGWKVKTFQYQSSTPS